MTVQATRTPTRRAGSLRRAGAAGAAAVVLALGPGLAVGTGTASAALYFENCAEAKAAGYTNMLRGTPGWRPGLESNNAGVACVDSAGDLRGGFSGGSVNGRTAPPPPPATTTPAPVPTAQTRSSATELAGGAVAVIVLVAIGAVLVSRRESRRSDA